MRSIVVAALLPLMAGTAAAQEAARLSVTGEGRVPVAPDMATITLGVTASADTAKAAMDQTSEGVAALLATVAAAGIEGRDVQTSGLALNPVWDNASYQSGPPSISGFSAVNTVTVRVRDLDGLGPLLDRVLDGGTNTFNGLEFGLQEPGPALDEARAAAVADARRKAEVLAGAAAVTLGPVVSIAEDQGMANPAPMFRMEAAMASDSVPVAAGAMLVTARVAIVWEIGE